MTFMRTILFILASIITAAGTSVSEAAVHNVSTSAALQAALDKAVAGDEIVLADGTYAGEFYIRSFSGNSTAPITVRAANKHKAIMQGTNACDRFQEGFVISKSWWIIKDLKFRDHGRAISISASNVEIQNNIVDHFREEGIRVEGVWGTPGTPVTDVNIHSNIIAFGDACTGDAPGIYLVNNADNNIVRNNIVFATGDNGYQFGNKNGYGVLIANQSDQNLVQGNLLFANAGKAVFRILAGPTYISADQNTARLNVVRDNAFLWGEGGTASDDCSDDSSEFTNNIVYGNYHSLFFTKGNVNGTRGNHSLRRNLFYLDDFTRSGVVFASGGCGGVKINNSIVDNLFYSSGVTSGSHVIAWVDSSESTQISVKSNNLFWAPGSDASWRIGYTYVASDIRSQPIFANPTLGDFSLASGSPGKRAASDGRDIGVEYSAYLKRSWLQNVFSLPSQQKDNLATTTSLTVDPTKHYQVWFYIPESNPYQGIETFNVEGQSLQRDIKGLTMGNVWVQPGGPARWITLGRHRASDGTLNISWSNSGSASKIFIRELPTADEAYSWISGTATTIPPPPPPPTTTSLAIPARIEAEAFSIGGQGIGYNETTSANLGGAYRTSEAVDIKLAPGGVGYTIGYTDSGEWLKYDVNVAQSGNYTFTARGANGGSTNGNFRVEVDGVNATGTISIPPTGSYSTETTVNGPTIPLAQGPHTLRVYFESSNFDLNWIELSASSVGSVPVPPGNVVVTAQ